MQSLLTNISRVIIPLTFMVLAISYASGVWMIMHALTRLKKFGNMHMQAQPGELGGPLMQLVVGAVLIYLPTATNVLTHSLFGENHSIFSAGSVNYRNAGYGAERLGYLPTGFGF